MNMRKKISKLIYKLIILQILKKQQHPQEFCPVQQNPVLKNPCHWSLEILFHRYRPYLTPQPHLSDTGKNALKIKHHRLFLQRYHLTG